MIALPHGTVGGPLHLLPTYGYQAVRQQSGADNQQLTFFAV
jgi:hypothetical protein